MVIKVYEDWAAEALRGLAVAYLQLNSNDRIQSVEALAGKFIFVGLVGLQDSLRPEAKDAIQTMHQAGITTIMLTGDYRNTGRAVAERLGLIDGPNQEQLLDGSEVDTLNDQQLRTRLPLVRVATRLTPEHKLRIAQLLKQNGEVVAMTGDGINDVPALLEANVGVAVGQSASDAAKEAADILLLDGNFQSIITAITEGRRIFQNIRRVIFFLLATSVGELGLIMVALLAGWSLPLLPTQIIWLNFITGPFLGIALTREPLSASVMNQRPHNPNSPIVTRAMWKRIVAIGITIAASGLLVFIIAQASGASPERTYALVLTTMVSAELMNAITARSSRRSIFTKHAGNHSMVLAILVVILLQLAILYIPPVANVFRLGTITPLDIVWVLLASLPVLVVEEIRKWWIRRQSTSTIAHAKI